MRIAAVLPLVLLIAACATAPPPPPPVQVFHDDQFAPPTERVDPTDIFALNDEMKHYLHTEIMGQIREKGMHQGFFEALYTRGQLRLDYDSLETRNAREAFADRSGNCLSLIIMTAAFAKALNMPVWFQEVNLEETWSRRGDIQFFIGHVNVALGKRQSEMGIGHARIDTMVIDFLPPQELKGLPVKQISEETVVAMYMNNRAAETFAKGELDQAYWWARGAIVADPKFASTYNTLGVIYRRKGNPDAARVAFDLALERDPDNPRMMSNLVPVLHDVGRQAEADALARKLERIEPDPPFAYFVRGQKAMQEGHYYLAREYFAREIARAPYYHEFHYWLGVAYANLGEPELARKELALALEYSTTRKDQELYSTKLDRIKAALTR